MHRFEWLEKDISNERDRSRVFGREHIRERKASRCPPFVVRMLAVQCRVLVSRRSTKGSKTRRECQSRRRGWRGKARGVIPLKESRGEPRRWAWCRTGERRRKGEKIVPPLDFLKEESDFFFIKPPQKIVIVVDDTFIDAFIINLIRSWKIFEFEFCNGTLLNVRIIIVLW